MGEYFCVTSWPPQHSRQSPCNDKTGTSSINRTCVPIIRRQRQLPHCCKNVSSPGSSHTPILNFLWYFESEDPDTVRNPHTLGFVHGCLTQALSAEEPTYTASPFERVVVHRTNKINRMHYANSLHAKLVAQYIDCYLLSIWGHHEVGTISFWLHSQCGLGTVILQLLFMLSSRTSL